MCDYAKMDEATEVQDRNLRVPLWAQRGIANVKNVDRLNVADLRSIQPITATSSQGKVCSGALFLDLYANVGSCSPVNPTQAPARWRSCKIVTKL